MSFVKDKPYIVKPIKKFGGFKLVSWEKGIYPKFKWEVKESEARFFTNLIVKHNLKNICDFGLGGGFELSKIIDHLNKTGYSLDAAEANEVEEEFIKQAINLFSEKGHKVTVHKANWIDLPEATPAYDKIFDFGFLTGNSLTYIGGASKEYTKKAQLSVVNNIGNLIAKNGYLFIDSRNYNYIKSLRDLSEKKLLEEFKFDYSVYYHGGGIITLPVYISDAIIVFHYYDIDGGKWSEVVDLYPILKQDMVDMLSHNFTIEKIYHDFQESQKNKSLFIQYLARKK